MIIILVFMTVLVGYNGYKGQRVPNLFTNYYKYLFV